MSKCNCSVKIENISVRDGEHLILNSISFQVDHGEILALVGKNGSGKTTILKTILNRIPYSGKISFFNSSGKIIINPKIGYVPQKLNFEKSTPLTVCEFFASNICNFILVFQFVNQCYIWHYVATCSATCKYDFFHIIFICKTNILFRHCKKLFASQIF